MAAISLTQDNLVLLKRRVRELFSSAKSSYISEALAASLGRRTHAALSEDFKKSNLDDPEVVLLDEAAFRTRLRELGVDIDPRETHLFDALASNQQDGLIRTSRPSANASYESTRRLAWRNMMVAAINAGIEQKLFSVRRGDNRWPRISDAQWNETYVYKFVLGNIPAVASVADAGSSELSIHVAFWPSEQGERFVRAFNAGFSAGEAFASGYLERETGAYIQSPSHVWLQCRKDKLKEIAELDMRPKGFGDRGPFHL